MKNTTYIPRPVFDTLVHTIEQYKIIYENENPRSKIRRWLTHCFSWSKETLPQYVSHDYQLALNFLYSYRGSNDTFNAYRREIERLLQWSWFVRRQSILKHTREDIEAFVEFCIKPHKRWIGLKTTARFKQENGERIPNPYWCPFEVRVTKKEHKEGKEPDKSDYKLSDTALKVMFGILGSFYNYLFQEEAIQSNPVMLIRQKSKFLRKTNKSSENTIRRLSSTQWMTVLDMTKEKAKHEPQHERTVFILSCLYGMYLRISELVASDRWTPTMGDFFKDDEGNWWFKTVGKGNKMRRIAVSLSMLQALKHYREHLKLSPYPTLGEKLPLISHAKNINAPITSQAPIRKLVQRCFDEAADQLEENGEANEADLLRTATVHWLRHTGISEDVKRRPREHVRDDAGHSSGAITDKYIDVGLSDRARSARDKKIDEFG